MDQIKHNYTNILIGPNGSGKSSILRDLLTHRSSDNIIVMSGTMHDKFRGRKNSKRYHFIGGRLGTRFLHSVISKTVEEIHGPEYREPQKYSRSQDILAPVRRALNYIGFSGRIGLQKISRKNHSRLIETQNFIQLAGYPSFEIKEGPLNAEIVSDHLEDIHPDSIAWTDIEGSSKHFENLKVVRLLETFEEISEAIRMLRKIKISGDEKEKKFASKLLKHLSKCKKKRYYLEIGLDVIPIEEISSGEAIILATILHISLYIDHQTTILIDEPETSLHPNWQLEYVDLISDLFYQYRPTIVLATHSPLLISRLTNINENKIEISINLYDCKKREEAILPMPTTSIEEILWEFFGILSPANHFLSSYTIDCLNKLEKEQITLSQFKRQMNELLSSSYNNTQRAAIHGAIDLSEKIVSKFE